MTQKQYERIAKTILNTLNKVGKKSDLHHLVVAEYISVLSSYEQLIYNDIVTE